MSTMKKSGLKPQNMKTRIGIPSIHLAPHSNTTKKQIPCPARDDVLFVLNGEIIISKLKLIIFTKVVAFEVLN